MPTGIRRLRARFIAAVTLIAAIAGSFIALEGESAYAGPFDPWAYTRTISIDNSGRPEKADFPVRVALSQPGNFDFSQAKPDGSDVRFTESDGVTQLAYFVESWSPPNAVLWVKVPSIPAGATKTITMFTGNSNAQPVSDIEATFPMFADDFTSIDDFSAAGLGATDGAGARVFNSRGHNNGDPIIQTQPGTWKAQQVREIGNVVFDPAADPARRWKFTYSGRGADNSVGVGIAFSADGETWTDASVASPIIARGEDPYIVRNLDGSAYRDGAGLLHLYAEEKFDADVPEQNGINHFTSSDDGLTWVADPANPVFGPGTPGEWDSRDRTSPVVVYDGTGFVMLFEGRPDTDDPLTPGDEREFGQIGVARSVNGSNWNSFGVIVSPSSSWNAAAVVPDDIVDAGDRWVLTAHGNNGTNWNNEGRYFATDAPSAWVPGSFSEAGLNNPFTQATSTVMFRGADPSRVVLSPDDTRVFSMDVEGDSQWKLDRFGQTMPLVNDDVNYGRISLAGGRLRLEPTGSGQSFTEVVSVAPSVANLTSDFAIGFKRRSPAGGGGSASLAQVGIGGGLGPWYTNNAGTDEYQWASFDNGYVVQTQGLGTNGLRLRRYDSGISASPDPDPAGPIDADESANDAVHELSYYGVDGQLRYRVNGTLRLSGSDSAHLGLQKGFFLGQGATSADGGSSSDFDWVFVRPTDGNDPVTSVGAATTTTTTTPPTTQPPAASGGPGAGYWMVDTLGRVYAFGGAPYLGNAPTTSAVDIEPTPSRNGYWIINKLGQVYAFGDAKYLGNVNLSQLVAGETVASISATKSGNGYWVFTNKGRAITFGDAPHYGDMSSKVLNGPVLGSIVTPSGNGYYMVASDGGVFSFGDAQFYGSMGDRRLNAPVMSVVPDADGAGYWLVAFDGGVFAFDAPFKGSMGATPLNKPVIGMVRYGDGYLMVGADGGIFSFSNQPFFGSLGSNPPSVPVVSVAATQ